MMSRLSCLEWEEKREWDRIEIDAEVWMRNRSLGGAGPANPACRDVPCRLIDISFGGARVTSDRLIGAKGHCVELTLAGPHGEMFSLPGEVIRLEQRPPIEYILAIQFVRLPVQDEVLLTQALLAYDQTTTVRSRPLTRLSRRNHLVGQRDS